MSKWKPALALLLVFIAGMFVGVVGTRIVVRSIARQMLLNPAFAQQRISAAAELQLARRLHLGPLQRQRVREILAEMSGQLKLINEETQPRRQMVISNAADQIDLVLGPEQKLEFEKLKEENRALMQPTPALPQLQQQQH